MKHIFNNAEEAINTVIESAKNHARATDTGDYKTANKNYHNINGAISYLLEKNSIKDLKKLLRHDEVSVRVWVATYLIKQGDKQAIEVLEGIASQSIPHHSFGARIVLQQWHKKNINL